MRKLFTLLAFIVITILNAQAPQGFNYQATVRNSSGTLISNQNVYFKFNIMLNSQTSVPVYSEIHYVPTDDMGQVNLIVGQGTPTIGTFTVINWANGTYYLGIELNTGTGYVAMGTTQLLSVPYALYANSSGNSEAVTPNLGAVLAVSNSANNTKITNLQNPTEVLDAANKGYIDSQLQTQVASLQTQNSTLQAQITALQTQITAGQVAYPVLTTTAITGINGTTATAGGNSTSDGNATITARGVCWSTTANPTDALSTKTVDGTVTGAFTSAITGLTANTNYYVRAYATNSFGTAYGAQVSFNTLTSNIAPVTIGTQTWSSTNLDVTTYSDGTPIPQVTDPTQWAALTTGAWCYYNNDSANGTTYGKLYNWYAVAGMDDNDPNTPNKILAPIGFHVPSDAEWTTLIDYLGGGGVAGGKMKEIGTTHWASPNISATNTSGFTALPGGLRYGSGDVFEGGAFNYINHDFNSWTSSGRYTPDAGSINVSFNTRNSYQGYLGRSYGLSVRCLKD